MANKYEIIFSNSTSIREIKIKLTQRYPFTPTRENESMITAINSKNMGKNFLQCFHDTKWSITFP